VAVGGTDFGDTYHGTVGTYWRTTNSSVYESAKSYVPEIPWNDSCASVLRAKFFGFSKTYGSDGFCNSSTGYKNFLTTFAGSGGPSSCAAGKPSFPGVADGSCVGHSKPSWQKGVIGLPSNKVRDLPDLSLFAALGAWGHYFIFCSSDTSRGGRRCTGSPANWAGGGGTSISSPIMAGIQALVNEHVKARQGNPNYVYYKLAAKQYGKHGDAACNAAKGDKVAGSCIFYDITEGDSDIVCTGLFDCYWAGGFFGVATSSPGHYKRDYDTTTGWDYATGIGSVNAYNLAAQWKTVSP